VDTAWGLRAEGGVKPSARAVSVRETRPRQDRRKPTEDTAMPNLQPAPSRPDPILARTLWQWLALGLVAMLLVPAARGPVYLLGNMPFWLLLAPGTGLVILYRHALAAAWRRVLVPAPRRRRRSQACRRGRASFARRECQATTATPKGSML